MRIFKIIILALSSLLCSCSSEPDLKTFREISLNKGWEFKAPDNTFKSAKVPGSIQTDLFAHQLIPDPTLPINSDSLRWIHQRNWEYEMTFDISEELLSYKKLFIQFDGIDTYSDIYLNDSLVEATDNMFRKWRIDAKKHLQPGANKLTVVLKSPAPKKTKSSDSLSSPIDSSVSITSYGRKAAYHFNEKSIPMGITRSVKLICWNEAIINDMHIKPVIVNKDSAVYAMHLDINSSYTQKGYLSFHCRQPGTSFRKIQMEEEIEISPGKNFYKVDLTIRKPNLWWPNGYGEQTLYQVSCDLIIKDQVIQKVNKSIGVRSLELVQTPDSATGTGFVFKVNDTPIFIKGATYLPSLYGTKLSKKEYASMLENATAAHMNMLRVSGKSVYETDEFYDLCDEKGILVWQDFMFHGSNYSGDDEMAYTIKKEAIDHIKRLRDHACLAVWCGNTTPLSSLVKDSSLTVKNYERIFKEILPDAVETYDAEHSYIASPPMYSGDERFHIDFGFPAWPDDENFTSIIAPNAAKRNRIHQELIKRYNTPQSTRGYAILSQMLQADLLKNSIEARRRNKPFCMGVMYSQFNDYWPGISPSTVDYLGTPKLAQFKVAQSFKDIIVSIVEENDTIKVFGISDRQKAAEGTLRFQIGLFDGKSLLDSNMEVSIPANASKLLTKFPKKAYVFSFTKNYAAAHAQLSVHKKVVDNDVLYFSAVKDMYLHRPNVNIEITDLGDQHLITLQADSLVKGVILNDGVLNGTFNDNYLDLFPKTPVTVTYNLASSKALNLRQYLSIMTLDDVYKITNPAPAPVSPEENLPATD